MGGKRDKIVGLKGDIEYLQLELEASRKDKADWMKKFFDQRREAEESAATISVLEQTIVDQAVSLFGIVRDAGATSVEAGLSPVYNGAGLVGPVNGIRNGEYS